MNSPTLQYILCLMYFTFALSDLREILHTEMDRLWQHHMPKNTTKASESHSHAKLRPEKFDISMVFKT